MLNNETSFDSINEIVSLRAEREDSIWFFPQQERRLRLREMDALAGMCANRLKDLGIGAGDCVGLILANSADYVILLLALWRRNAIAVPLRPHVTSGPHYQNYIKVVDTVCDFSILICDDSIDRSILGEIGVAASTSIMSLSHLICINDESMSYVDDRVIPDAGDIAILQFTSGSTGDPKGVIVTHNMMMNQLRHMARGTRETSAKPIGSAGSWMPMNHDLGLIGGVLFPLYMGINNILTSPEFYMRNPKRWFTLLSEAGTDLNFTTNAAMVAACNVLSKSKDVSAIELSGLHIFFAAEKLSASVLDRTYNVFSPLGMTSSQFHVAYGMAENTLGCTVTPRGRIRNIAVVIEADGQVLEPDARQQQFNRVVSVGAPFLDYDITIRNEAGEVLPDRWLGEIWIYGDCVTPGYYRNSEATTQKIDGQIFKTGDLGFVADGELFFVARQDDIINIGGSNISPDDVESVVETLEFLGPGRSCLIAAEDSATGLTKPILIVEVSARMAFEAASVWRSQIQGAVMRNFGLMVGTIRLCAKGTIEKTSSGKKRRKVILERYLQGMIPDIGEKDQYAKFV